MSLITIKASAEGVSYPAPGAPAGTWNTTGGAMWTVVGDNLDTTYIQDTAFGDNITCTIPLVGSLASDVLAINTVWFYFRGRCDTDPALHDCGSIYVRKGAGTFGLTPQILSGAVTEYTVLETLGPDGLAWTLNTFKVGSPLEFQLNKSVANGHNFRVMALWLIADVTFASGQIESAREIGSRRLRARRLPNGLIEVLVPSLQFIDQELMDLVGLSNPELPSLDGLGAGVKPWQRWPCVKVRSEIQWATGSELMQLRDLREYVCAFWDVGKSLKSSASLLDGVARLTSASRLWERSTVAYVTDPSGDRVTKVDGGRDKLDKEGLLFESGSTNEVIQSAFKNGAFTGWTVSGSGTIAADTADLLFSDILTTAQSAKITANATIGTDLQAQGTATRSFTANAIVRASFWHKDDSGYAMSYAIQRAFDSNWWRDSDSTWQAGKTWNALTVTATRARHKSKQINVGANATTLTVFFGVPTTGTGGQINHCYHVQIEEKKFMGSTIPTEGTSTTTAADKLSITNYSQAPSWPPDRGVFRCYVVPEWDAADVATVNKTLIYVLHDAQNSDWIYYDGANTRWVYERLAAGVTYRATKTHSPVSGTSYKIAARWTSALQEQGLAAYTLSIYVDAVKGTDVTAAPLLIATLSSMEIGAKSGAENADAAVWGIEIIQQAFDDASVVRF